MPEPRQQPKDRICVLIITADNITAELLKNSFTKSHKRFKIETMTGTSDQIIADLGTHKKLRLP